MRGAEKVKKDLFNTQVTCLCGNKDFWAPYQKQQFKLDVPLKACGGEAQRL